MLRSHASPFLLDNLKLEQLRAGDISEFRRLFAAGVRFRLSRVQAPSPADGQSEMILGEAAEVTIAIGEQNQKLSFHEISEIVNSCIRRSLQFRITTAAVNPVLAGTNKIAAELGQLSSRERDTMTYFFLDEMSEEAACSATGLSVEVFQVMRKRFRAMVSEAGSNPSDGGLATLGRALGPSVGSASTSVPTHDVLKGAA